MRAVGLVHHYFGTDPAGHKIAASPLHPILFASSVQLPIILIAGALFLALWQIAAKLRPMVTGSAVTIFTVLVLLGQVDFGMLRFLGQRFTPSVMRTYVGPNLASTELYQLLLHDFFYVASSLGIVAVGWLLIGLGCVWYRRRETPFNPPRLIALALVLPATVVALPSRAVHDSQFPAYAPAEMLFVRALLRLDRTPAPANELAAIAQLRDALDPTSQHRWLDPDFPIARAGVAAPAAPETTLPDIVLIVVESLRGQDVGYRLATPSHNHTARLDELAQRSVVFTRFISNGFPSSRGFFSINTSLWPHPDKVVLSNFPELQVDALPQRLKENGYVTMALWGSNPSFDSQLDWGRRWYDRLVFELPENKLIYVKRMSDAAIMDELLSFIDEHDTRDSGRPFFAYVSTAGTHYPYTLENSYFVPLTALGDVSDVDTGDIEDPQRRYEIVLQNLDEHIGRVIDALDARHRKDNTILIVTGDHSNRTNEATSEAMRGMPVDHMVWTTALVYGPERLIGPTPRRLDFPSSQVDLLPTIMAMIGDNRPFASVGTDLFAPIPPEQRVAVSVSEAGYRIDRGNHSLFVSAINPESFEIVPQPGTTRPDVSETESREAALSLHRQIRFWSYLVESNRIWRPTLLNDAR